MSIGKIKRLMINVHTSWCLYLIKDKEKSYNITQTYDLSNHTKVLIEERHEKTTSLVNTFHGRFSVLSALLTPIKLNVYNFLLRYCGESKVHSGSMIEIIIPQNCFILFHRALVHCRTLSWYIESELYHQNTRSFFL